MLRNILLVSAAGLCAFATADAADLPSLKSAPVDYVRVCAEHGKGFFYIPGSDTCVRLGGRLRSVTLYNETNNRSYDSINFGAQARFNIDARANTSYGMARAFLRYSMVRFDNNFSSGFNARTTGIDGGGGLDVAFIKFAGLTAGRIQSFFDFYANYHNYGSIRVSDNYTQALSYTATLGNGWTLSASLEDNTERRVFRDATFNTTLGRGVIRSVGNVGQSVPDAVGALLVIQGWGAAQISAALHQVRPAFLSYTGSNSTSYNFAHDTDYGFAVSGGLKLNLPMIAPGDEFWLEASYADGAIGYLGTRSYVLGQGGVSLPMTDAFIDANGRLKRTRGWTVAVDLLHYWTPSVRQNVFGSYMQLNPGNSGYTSVTAPGVGAYNAGFVNATEWRVGTNLIWSPIKSFDIGVEILYTRLDPKGRVLSSNDTANGIFRTVGSDGAWQGRLNIQRDF